MASMAEIGLLQHQGRGQYWVGRRIVELSDTLICTADLNRAASFEMERLNHLLDETVHLAVLDRNRALLIDVAVARSAVYVEGPTAGAPVPLYCTSVGKALLAFQEPATLRSLLESMPLTYRTAQTPTEARILHRELENIRLSRVAYDRGEFSEDVRCVASPIIGSKGTTVLGAIGVSVPASRFEKRRPAFARAVVHAAEAISTAMN
jgi:DNA-binding IclR family transcriptional regulator